MDEIRSHEMKPGLGRMEELCMGEIIHNYPSYKRRLYMAMTPRLKPRLVGIYVGESNRFKLGF